MLLKIIINCISTGYIKTTTLGLSILLLFAQGAAADVPKIMPLGDSITAGWNQPSYRLPLSRALQARNCEVDIVGNQNITSHTPKSPNRYPGLHFPHFSPETHPGYAPGEHWDPALGDDTDHAGYPGYTADELLDVVWAAVRRSQPDYVLLHIGSNDVARSYTGTNKQEIKDFSVETIRDINALIDAILSSHRTPQAVTILLANMIPLQPKVAKKDWLDTVKMSNALSRYIAALARGRNDKRIQLVDVATGFDISSMTTDGIHPNAIGERHLADAFLTALSAAGLCQ